MLVSLLKVISLVVLNATSPVISTNKDATSIFDAGLPKSEFLGHAGKQQTRGSAPFTAQRIKNVTVLHRWAGSVYLPEAGYSVCL